VREKERRAKMGTQKKTRKFAVMKRMISKKDDRLKENQVKLAEKQRKAVKEGDEVVRAVPQVSSSLFFQCEWSLHLPSLLPIVVGDYTEIC
jgi:U3 small nucleolar RNA-associated protein 24